PAASTTLFRSNLSAALVKGNISVLENLAIFMALRPVQRLCTLTFNDALRALVRVASAKDIHVIVKASSVLLRIVVHERYNNVCFAGFVQSVCFLIRSLDGDGKLHTFNGGWCDLVLGQGGHSTDEANLDAVDFLNVGSIQHRFTV